MAVVFSKLSGKNDSLYKAVEGVLTEIIADVDNGKTNDDAVLEAIYNVKKSKKFGERTGGMTEFSSFDIVDEGGVAPQDELQEGFAKLIQHYAFSKGFTITREMIDDGRLDDAKIIAKNYMKAYKRSKLEFATKCLVTEGANFVYGTRTLDKTTGDAKGLFATDHPGKKSGVAAQSNVFTNALGTDIVMLNRLANIGRNFKNESGVINGYTFDTLIIPGNVPDLEETANRIIGTTLVVGSPNNDINTQKGKWRLIVNHRWEAPTGKKPYILMSSEANEALQGSVFYNRVDLDIANEVDLKTRNLDWSGYCRFSAGHFNWRHMILSGADTGTTLS
ncbi:MAG TPA: hypothetical protein VN631_12335 [Negativicutes bacterium]|nr:hypothetical protein [Negativicutes bacterium]